MYATGLYDLFIKQDVVGIGVIKGIDVIPYIEFVFAQAEVAKMPNIRYGWDKENIDTVLSDSFMLVKLCSTQQSTLLEADNPMLMAILSCR